MLVPTPRDAGLIGLGYGLSHRQSPVDSRLQPDWRTTAVGKHLPSSQAFIELRVRLSENTL